MNRPTAANRCAQALALAALLAAGCSRADLLNRRINEAPGPARAALGDAVWTAGSVWHWAEVDALKARARVRGAPGDPAAERDEAWRLDPWTGRVRIERPADGLVIDAGPAGLTVRRGKRDVTDPVERSLAAGWARLVRWMLAMPVGFLAGGERVTWGGERVGPGGARTWQVLEVAGADEPAGEPVRVSIRKRTGRVTEVEFAWDGLPWAGRRWRATLDTYGPAGPVEVARRWRLYPRLGDGWAADPWVTVELDDVETD